jgi:hypothetical protein
MLIRTIGFFLVLTVCMFPVYAVAMMEEPTPFVPTGTVHVDGYPVGMKVTLDKIPYGEVPYSGVFEIAQVPIGEHVIGAEMAGFQGKETLVTVSEGQITKIRVELLTKGSGTLDIQSNPPNVQVFLNDVYKGITPVILTDVPLGNHMVLLKLAGYQDWSSPVTLSPGDTQEVFGTLRRVSDGQPPVSLPETSKGASAGIPAFIVVFGIFFAMIAMRIEKQ